MDIQVPRDDPTAFERAFCSQHEALGLKTTASSGSKWGDGDAREVLDRSKLQFAMEAKCRFTSSSVKPKKSEWEKALSQLRKRDSEAVRLFAVYVDEKKNLPIADYAVTIPAEDCEMLRDGGIDIPPPSDWFFDSSETETGHLFSFTRWKDLYQNVKRFRANA